MIDPDELKYIIIKEEIKNKGILDSEKEKSKWGHREVSKNLQSQKIDGIVKKNIPN